MNTDKDKRESSPARNDAHPVAETAAGITAASEPAGREDRIMSAVRHFRVVVRAIQAHSSWVERQCGVTAAQLWALWEVFREPGIRVSDISRRLSIKPATASNLLDKIEAKGLVRRERRGPDQRVVRLFPTDDGARLLASAPRPAEGALLDALTRLDDQQLEALNGSLEALVDILRVKEEGSALAPIPPVGN